MRTSAVSLLALFLLPLTAAAGDAFELVQVADGVYAAIPKPTAPMAIGSNAAIIVNESDVLVVDTHLTPSAARALLAEIAALTDTPVRYVVNTHWHPDHVQGNQAYFNVFPGGTEFISHHATREDIQKKAIPSVRDQLDSLPQQIAQAEEQLARGLGPDGEPLTEEQKPQRRQQIERQKAYLAELRQMQVTLPTLTFERSLILHKERRPIHILFFFKGHTRGDAVVYLPQEKVLITGDLLTAGLPFPRDSYPAEWVKTLRAVAGLDFAQAIPGHGPVQQGKEHLELVTQVFESVVEQVRAAVARGLTLEETKKAVDLEAFREAIMSDPVYGRAFHSRVEGTLERAYLEATGELQD
ncbi:MAG: MBL fold metallo-hydrolase [Acidobacteria bacterium]|nr:MBL fold metallo-hydrolase [Acidobacteriota bacterium]